MLHTVKSVSSKKCCGSADGLDTGGNACKLQVQLADVITLCVLTKRIHFGH